MPETFTPPGKTNVSPGTELQMEPRVRSAPFGDGYEQRMGDGLNALREKYNVVINGLTHEEAVSVHRFLKDHKGYIYFMWTPPGDTEEKKWICQQWTKPLDGPTSQSIRAAFVEVFDP